MLNDESDTALVRAAQGGDREAFALLLTRYQQLLVALCRRTLADPVLAEDAAQEAALQAMLNIERLRQADRFGPWLGGIGLNICRRWLRERSRDSWSWEALHGGQRVPEWPDPQPGPEALLETADLANRVHLAIANLPPGQRSAVELFYLWGLTQAETAAWLGIDTGAVKTRLYKARRTLSQHLSNVWEDQTMGELMSRRTLAKTAGALAGVGAARQSAPTGVIGQQETRGNMTIGKTSAQLVQMRVADVRRKSPNDDGRARHYAAILEEVDGTRRLPIWMGEFEGTAIAVQLENLEVPRPLTFTFMTNLLQATGASLREVRIDRLVDNVFYAVAVVEGSGQSSATIDARPSDAINLALLSEAPIFVDSAVLEAVGETPNASQELAQSGEGPPEIVAELMGNFPPSQLR